MALVKNPLFARYFDWCGARNEDRGNLCRAKPARGSGLLLYARRSCSSVLSIC
jgi:hypothetical protein